MWSDYHVPGGTFRENLQNTPGKPFLPNDHPAAKARHGYTEVEKEAHIVAESTS
jgi:hypothetical protein